MKAKTNIAKSPEYQAALHEYKTNLVSYQGDTEWYFDAYETGLDFHGEEISLEEMQRAAKKVSPIGPPVWAYEIEDLTPSLEQYSGFKDYMEYMDWVTSQDDVFHYFREKDEFHAATGLQIAASLGYKKIVMENLS